MAKGVLKMNSQRNINNAGGTTTELDNIAERLESITPRISFYCKILEVQELADNDIDIVKQVLNHYTIEIHQLEKHLKYLKYNHFSIDSINHYELAKKFTYVEQRLEDQQNYLESHLSYIKQNKVTHDKSDTHQTSADSSVTSHKKSKSPGFFSNRTTAAAATAATIALGYALLNR